MVVCYDKDNNDNMRKIEEVEAARRVNMDTKICLYNCVVQERDVQHGKVACERK